MRSDWKAEIKWVPITEVQKYVRNAKTHPKEQIDKIAGQISTVGWTVPMVVDMDMVLIAGHGRLLAAESLGVRTVPVIVADHLTDQEVIAARIADNKVAESAWDLPQLAFDLGTLQRLEVDLSTTGFDLDEAKTVLATLNAELPGEGGGEGSETDKVPAAPLICHTKLGDIFTLGRHRLACGDVIKEPFVVNDLLNGARIDFVYMDPPYGMNHAYEIQGEQIAVKKNTYERVQGDDVDFDPRPFFERFSKAREQFWWGADYYCQRLPTGGSWVVWDKKMESLDASIGAGFELCWSMNKHKRDIARFLWSGFTAKESDEARAHPTQKPVALHQWIFEKWGQSGDHVVDLFAGSGSTLIACEKSDRKCFTAEIDPHYCDVIIERWMRLTGQEAVRDDGLTWSAIKALRVDEYPPPPGEASSLDPDEESQLLRKAEEDTQLA